MDGDRGMFLVRTLLVGLIASAFVLLLQWTASVAQEDAVSTSAHNCGALAQAPVGSLGFETSPASAVFLSPEEDLELRIRFLTARGYRTSTDLVLAYKSGAPPDPEVFPSGSAVALQLSVFKRDSDGNEIRPADHVVYVAQATDKGVNVRVCFNADSVPPGRYQSTVRLADPKLQAAPVPIVITIQENRWGLMVALAAGAVVVGVAVLYIYALLIALAQAGTTVRFWDGPRLAATAIGTAAGLAAVWAVYVGDYYSNEAFGARGMQYFFFGVSCFAAFMAAATLAAGVAQGGVALATTRTQDTGATAAEPVDENRATAGGPDE